MSVVEELRQNDPARTSISIYLYDEPSDADLAQALEQNPFVTEMELYLNGEQGADWTSLLHVIATRFNLGKVELVDAFGPEERNAPAGLVRALLQAIQPNTAIRCVKLWWLRLPNNISTFVDTASSITSLRISNCDMEQPGEREQGASDLAAALQRNTNIERLELSNLEDIYAVPMLEGLRSNVSLKTFFLHGNVSDETAHAIHQLLGSTTSIQRFEWKLASCSESRFCPVAQAITRSECVSELKFELCRFEDQSSIAQLRSILQNKRNLTSLCLDNCNFGRGQVHGDIISILLRLDSPLRCFEFYCGESEHILPDIQFKNLLRAIEKSKLLERFSIGTIQTQQQLQTLIQSIPSMKLKELEVGFCTIEGSHDEDGEDEDEDEGGFNQETIRQDLLHAMKNNFTLWSVRGKIYGEHGVSDLFDTAEDLQRLALYTNRNKSVDQWVNNPETVGRKVWPEALKLAERAGSDALFCGLRFVLESDYVKLKSGRKRQRTQFYAPS